MEGASLPDWINAISVAVGSLAVCIGLVGAKLQIERSRKDARAIRRSEVAEELISLSHTALDSLRQLRSPMDSIPREKLKDKVYPYQTRYERVVASNDLFKKLRDAQIRVRAVIGDAEVDKAVDSFFNARNAVAISLQHLAEEANRDEPLQDASDRDWKRKLRSDVYGLFNESDELGNGVVMSLKTIEEKLNPIARLES